MALTRIHNNASPKGNNGPIKHNLHSGGPMNASGHPVKGKGTKLMGKAY